MDDSAGSEAVDSFSFHGDVGVKRVPVGMRADDSESDEEAGAGDVNALLDSVLDPDAEVSAEQPEEEPYEVIIRPKERATPVARPQSESCAQVRACQIFIFVSVRCCSRNIYCQNLCMFTYQLLSPCMTGSAESQCHEETFTIGRA